MNLYPPEDKNKKNTALAIVLGIAVLALIIFFEIKVFNQFGTFFFLFAAAVVSFFFFTFGKIVLGSSSKVSKADLITGAADPEIRQRQRERQRKNYISAAIAAIVAHITLLFLPKIVEATTTYFCNSHGLQIPDDCPQLGANYGLALLFSRRVPLFIIPLEVILLVRLFKHLRNE